MKAFREAYARYEPAMIALKVRHSRVRKCHAQLHAGLEALAAIMKVPSHMLEEGHAHIDRMALTRDASIQSDHPVVSKFWEIFDYIDAGIGLNHARTPDKVAVNLLQFEQEARKANLTAPSTDELKKHLKSSRSRPFIDIRPVNSRLTEKAVHCWVFASEPASNRKGH
ncbi:MAG: hypothetical protein AAGC58_12015 [Asticcacaulis sp.]